ncbi:hypothetical protein, partial [Escherichia coli]|uniref:hypothetical protein n=1 Tax=Escherichia coli TaxID=562 RepID=UPI001BB47F67
LEASCGRVVGAARADSREAGGRRRGHAWGIKGTRRGHRGDYAEIEVRESRACWSAPRAGRSVAGMRSSL